MSLIINDKRRHNFDGSPRYNTSRQDDKNYIPPITESLGSGWKQPSQSRMLIDDTSALMTLATFKELTDYSCTMPSGVYAGKMWRRHDGSFDHAWIARGGKPVWMLAWYGRSDRPGYCSTQWRTILLTDANIEEQR